VTSSFSENQAWYDEHYYRNAVWPLAPWHRLLLTNLVDECSPDKRLLELGCGQAQVPRLLVQEKKLLAENTYGIDQSNEAIKFAQRELPEGRFKVQDIYEIDYPRDYFDIGLMLETIEHLEKPEIVLDKVYSQLKPGGCFYISFPNYLHLPWLVVRLLAQWLNHPNWTFLQPVDKIYTIFTIKKLAANAGLVFEKGIGCNYGPPAFHHWESDRLTVFLNRWHCWWWSFHPILKFRKPH
jgi:SAM-dependent methyltransferase